MTTTDCSPIPPLLRILARYLDQAAEFSSQAETAAEKGEINQAIGTLVCIDELLTGARALHDASLIVHREGGKGGVQ